MCKGITNAAPRWSHHLPPTRPHDEGASNHPIIWPQTGPSLHIKLIFLDTLSLPCFNVAKVDLCIFILQFNLAGGHHPTPHPEQWWRLAGMARFKLSIFIYGNHFYKRLDIFSTNDYDAKFVVITQSTSQISQCHFFM